jgi:hypothetical protein
VGTQLGEILRGSNKLSAIAVARLKEPGRYADGGGLYLQVAVGGTKAWLFRFMRDGQARQMGLGPIRDVSLADARCKASEARKQLLACPCSKVYLAWEWVRRLIVAEKYSFAGQYIVDVWECCEMTESLGTVACEQNG